MADQRWSRREYLTLLGVAAASSLAACTAATATSSSPTSQSGTTTAAIAHPAAPSPAGVTQAPTGKTASIVRFAVGPTLFYDAFRQMALHKGFFREAGLDVQITTVNQGGTIMARGLVADQFDVAMMGPDPILAAAAEANGGAKLVSAIFPGVVFGVYAQNEYQSLAELEGKPFGISAPGSLPERLLLATLRELNLDPDNFTRVNVGGAGASSFQAVRSRKVEATVASVDFIRDAEQSGVVRLLVPMSSVIPKYLTSAEAVGDAFMTNKRDVLQEFLDQHVRGIRYALGHRDEAVALAAEQLAVPADTIEWEFDFFTEQHIVNPDAVIPSASLDYQAGLALRNGIIKREVRPERFYDGSFAKRTLDKLGAFRGSTG